MVARAGADDVPEMPAGGWCDPRFAAVRDAFAANFADLGETGAAVCVRAGGAVVADLWGGWAGPGERRPWQPDTLVNVFSVGKGLLAACVAALTGDGMIDTDAPVARYWPQFAAAGKDRVTVRQLLSHQAGLPALRAPLPAGSALDWRVMTAALAAEQPWWPPGERHGYHVNTFGFLAGEMIRRVTGLTAGAALRQRLAGPLGADVHIGLPAAEHARVAYFCWPQPADDRVLAGSSPDLLMARHAYANPPELSGARVINTAAWRAAEVPSANAHATAAGVATVYAALAAGGAAGGARVLDAGALSEATRQQVYGPDLVLARPTRFGLGFQLTHAERPLGRGPQSFGHFGAGGSVGMCDPDAGLALGYVTSQMGPRWQNPRNRALIDAAYSCL
jgi:CubicO group peptidase (beta-lactamase class C family)